MLHPNGVGSNVSLDSGDYCIIIGLVTEQRSTHSVLNGEMMSVHFFLFFFFTSLKVIKN